MAAKLLVNHYDAPKPNTAGFIVFGAGLPRTGTSSLKKALSQLLDGSCYHMADVIQGTEVDFDFWEKAMNDQTTGTKTLSKKDWIDFLQGRGYRSGVDFPISNFYSELLEIFPDAKVILTVRDDPSSWYKSVKESIYQSSKLQSDFAVVIFETLVGIRKAFQTVCKVAYHNPPGFEKGVFGVIESGPVESAEFYNRWNEQVKKIVPQDRLLVFNVKQGWQPLCDFLGVPVPQGQKFPFENETKVIQSSLQRMKIMSYILVYGIPVGLASLGVIFQDSITSLFGI